MTTPLSLAEIRRRLLENHESIQPHLILGDEDSIHLTPYQEGQRWGLSYAMRLIDMAGEQPVPCGFSKPFYVDRDKDDVIVLRDREDHQVPEAS